MQVTGDLSLTSRRVNFPVTSKGQPEIEWAAVSPSACVRPCGRADLPSGAPQRRSACR
ncbi:hypothetical protein PSP6_10139 [Paraburkholderia tropica]|nr:hypothetical protein PSP6_10139 [Paraburkholderia tropica]